jgi:hypothetical protein
VTRREYVLAVLAASEGAVHTPVQVQKLFFLLDQKAAPLIGGARFHFRPYDYGPFDKEVYEEITRLADSGDAEIALNQSLRLRTYRLTPAGILKGRNHLGELGFAVAGYIRDISAWVRSISFESLVSTIYREYPEMKANSVFRGAE